MAAVRRDSGFTLVELLVVMLIVGTLAGIAVPAFAGQRVKAQKAAMTSDLRSLVQAQTARAVDGDYTDSTALLRQHGYATSAGVAPATVELVAGGAQYVACVRHDAVDEWLVHDSASGTTRWAADCEG